MRVGVVVNPIAGMGGRVGLKGTDEMVEEARARGAEPRAPERAREALEALRNATEGARTIDLFAYGGGMGDAEARDAGFDPTVVGAPSTVESAPDSEVPETDAADTRAAVRAFVNEDVDLILFVGGDGTAVDVAETLDELDSDTPILGVPAGVKVYSAVFAATPRDAGRIVATFEDTEQREVNDIDEEAYREGEVRAELKAIARVPVAPDVQSGKQLGGGTVEQLAMGVADEIESGVTYVLGPGSTVGAIKEQLGFEGSPLGVDVWRDDEVVVRDARESEILDALGEENVIYVSPIGGQGFVFGRGNQQISPDVIRESDVRIVASKAKLDQLSSLRVDTGDADLDEALRGWHRVRVGRYEHRMMKIV